MMKNEYESKNQELFAEWKRKHFNKYGQAGFVTDGIIDTNTWFSQDCPKEKILFILKEAFDSSNEATDWNETKWINQEKCTDTCKKNAQCDKCSITGNTFNPIANIVYGLLDDKSNGKFDPWLGIKSKDHNEFIDQRCKLLKEIAIINIKKSGGKSNSSSDDIYYYAADDKELLIRQINLISPTLIICGGTYNYLRCILTDLPKLEDPSNGACIYKDSIKIIATLHPNAHNPNEEKYQRIIDCYKCL